MPPPNVAGNEVQWPFGRSGRQPLFRLWDAVGRVFRADESGGGFVWYQSEDYLSYYLPMAEAGGSGFYAGAMPEAPSCPAGVYRYTVHDPEPGQAPAEGEPCVFTDRLRWNGGRVFAPRPGGVTES